VTRGRAILAGAVLAVGLGLVAALAYASAQNGEGANGAGFDYRGQFYSMSGAEVRRERLGPVLDRSVALRDTSTDVRAILDIDPGIAVAARVHDMGGTASEGRSAWLLMSPDVDLAADPWSDADLVSAVHPAE
jgi:hypothetical protein